MHLWLCWFIHDWLLCSSDCAHHPPAPLLPADLEALGLFPVPWHHHCHISGGLIRLRGDRGELLLHPQHLAHAHRRERRLPSAATCQTWRESHSPEAAARLRLPALCERARGDGTGGPSDHYHQQHMHQLMMLSNMDFYLPFFSFLWIIKTRKTKPENLLTDAL